LLSPISIKKIKKHPTTLSFDPPSQIRTSFFLLLHQPSIYLFASFNEVLAGQLRHLEYFTALTVNDSGKLEPYNDLLILNFTLSMVREEYNSDWQLGLDLYDTPSKTTK